MDKIEQRAPTFVSPALIIQAGGDEVVDNRRQSRVSEGLVNSKMCIITGAKHELLMEADEYRQPCMDAILGFYHNAELVRL